MRATSARTAVFGTMPLLLAAGIAVQAGDLRLTWFSADVTVPLGRRPMGSPPARAREFVEPALVRGIVLEGAGRPIVLAAVGRCETQNDAYRRWRQAVAQVACRKVRTHEV